jgi:glucokinase
MDEALERFLSVPGNSSASDRKMGCCLSGAGPVRDNVSHLSNVSWRIDGPELESRFGMPTLVINDFSAICYGLPMLRQDDPGALLRIAHTDGSTGSSQGTVWAAVGAGTGLGIGYLATLNGRHLALPSEGGHADFATFDDETERIKSYVTEKLGCFPGSEQFVSGSGIVNIFDYLTHTGRFETTDTVRTCRQASEEERPAVISSAATTDPCCAETMRLFVRMYGKVASNAALHFLPSAGVYLAGGIAAKNETWFINDDTFMRAFETNYKASVRPFLKDCPVFIVREEAVALYGAAHAAEQFLT